jgi:hypothetical protein
MVKTLIAVIVFSANMSAGFAKGTGAGKALRNGSALTTFEERFKRGGVSLTEQWKSRSGATIMQNHARRGGWRSTSVGVTDRFGNSTFTSRTINEDGTVELEKIRRAAK